MRHFDAMIVGAGQSGPAMAHFLGDMGQKVAVAEEKLVGGSCVNFGCTPSKTLIASARAIYTAGRGDEFGFSTGKLTVNFDRVMERQRNIVTAMRERGREKLMEMKGVTFFHNRATFISKNEMQVGDETLTADKIYLNVGSRAAIPDIDGLNSVPYLTNQSILDLTELPKHLIMLGGGYISMEYAQAFRRFGSEITIIEPEGQVLGRTDKDVADCAREILEKEGVNFLLKHKAVKVEKRGREVIVHVENKGKSSEVVGSHLLVAVGRTPNSDTLKVENAGIKLDEKGYITVDNHLRTNVDGIYVLGEANGRGAFTHTSYNDFEIASDNLNGGKRKISDRILTYGVFIDPSIAHVGMTEAEVRESGAKALIGKMEMSKVNRATEFGQEDGFMKVLVDAENERFLGATIIGLGSDELIHSITDLMYAKAPYTVMKNAVHIHPTVSELLPTLLGMLEPLK
ncbi:MAG: mercuric reductase [Chloroflexi bacterium]|nr:mercuric reductase [Chloroflexota bacterium]